MVGVGSRICRDFFAYDSVCLLQQHDRLGRNLADDPHGQPRPWKRLSLDDLVRQAERPADLSDFVFEEARQRLHQFELQVVRQPANIVVALDLGGVASARLDHIGIQRALHQELGIACAAYLGCRLLKGANEKLADDAALLFRVAHASQPLKELVAGIGMHKLRAHVAPESLHYLFGFALAQQPRVYEHAGEAVAEGAMGESGRHRRVDPARQPADSPAVAHLRCDGGH